MAITTPKRRARRSSFFAACCAVGLAGPAAASELVEVLPLTDQVLMVHFDDGAVTLAAPGQKQKDDVVTVAPLDRAAASTPASYRLTSQDDPAYATAKSPTAVGRKSKGTEFSQHCDTWAANACVNTSPDRALEHWTYLVLPTPLLRGRTYLVDTGSLAANRSSTTLTFDETKLRSEAVHVNVVAYAAQAPQRFGYVYHWMGDLGGLDVGLIAGRACHLVRTSDGQRVFDGTVAFRMARTSAETALAGDTPGDNFLGADVAECDFSPFSTPGEYVLSVDGVGCSFPFRIDPDALRRPFYAAMKGLFLNRSGIEITAGYGDGYTRPAPHHPGVTPGFAGKLKYSSTRYPDVTGESGTAAEWEANLKGEIETWGWYQDAGDWDAYPSHATVPGLLLALYDVHPDRFADGELNIPESGNGIPDLLDEARWLVRFYHRTRHAILDKGWGTGGVGGSRVQGDCWGPDLVDGVVAGSWQDTQRTWVVSGEDPWMTYRYAGLAAHFAASLQALGAADPEAIDWRAEAEAAWTWAQAHTLAGDEEKHGSSLRQMRMHAAVALFRLTGAAAYHDAFKADFAAAGEAFGYDSRHWLWLYARLPAGQADAAIQVKVRASLAAQARLELADAKYERATRWGGNPWMPMFLGQGSTPLIVDGVLSLAAAGDGLTADERAAMRARAYTSADYFLGTNPLNMTWISRLGPRWPRGPFHLDGFTKGAAFPPMGLIPYGPVAVARDWMPSPPQGPWASNWPNSDLFPADIAAWPGHERWFDQRTGIASCEFTIHQTTDVTAVVYGTLLEAAKDPPVADAGLPFGDTGNPAKEDAAGATQDVGAGPARDGGTDPARDAASGASDGGAGGGPVGSGCGCQAGVGEVGMLGFAGLALAAVLGRRRRGGAAQPR